ncbi:MAG: OmpA family protein [Endomicrobia bacterium]|nr:OmpA family protein [Endomicrobiia bacterium]MCL2144813.1 OmpA family protein [Endomicrobiia bacterium]
MKKIFLILFALLIFAAHSLAQSEYELLSDSINIAEDVKAGRKITIQGFYFDSGSAYVNANLKNYLEKIADKIKKIRYEKIYIDGYTDNRGDNFENNKLSRARAQEVMKVLAANGIPSKKMQARAYGSSNPVADNSTKTGRIQNRRIEIVIQ